MADLIDSRQLIADLTAMKQLYDAISLDGIIDALRRAPTIDAVPVVHGRWIEHPDGGFICSVCESGMPEATVDGAIHRSEKRYCYYCGAKMDGGPND